MISSSNSTMNYTRMPPPMPLIWYNEPFNVAMFVLYIFVITVALIGNFLVCIAVCINPNLRQNVTSYFIISLAISDILTAAFSMPFDLESYMTFANWPHGEMWCIIWTTAYLITVPTSMWNLFILSIDRYKTLKNPWDRFKESPFMTKKRAVIIITLVWMFCMGYALLPAMGWKLQEATLVRHAYGTFCQFNITPLYSILSAVVNFYLPMLAMCFLYYKIYQIARTQFLSPSIGVELKTCDSNYSPAAKPKCPKRESKEFAQTHRKDEYETHNPSAANFKVNPIGKVNLAVELVEEKLNRSGTLTEELDAPAENAEQTTNCDDFTNCEREKDEERHDSFGDETETKVELQSAETNNYCDNPGSQTEDELQQTDGINESKIESSKRDRRNKDITCDINSDKDLNDGQNVQNTVDDNKEAGSQSPQTKSNEYISDSQEDGTELGEKDENLQNNHDGLFVKENMSDETTTAPHPPCEELNTEDNREVTYEENISDPTPAEDFLQQDTNPNTNMEHNTRSTIVDPAVANGCSSIVDHDQEVPSSSEQNENTMPKKSIKIHSDDSCHTPPQISSQMQEIVRKKICDQNGIKTAWSIDNICTVQRTLDDHNRVNTSRSDLSASRDTLTNFGSMEHLTERRKIFVKNKNAARTISIIVGAFLLCWFPRTTFSIAINICQKNCFNSKEAGLIRLYISHALTLLGYLSCVINPMIYSYRNVQFRKSYRKLIRKMFPCHREVCPS